MAVLPRPPEDPLAVGRHPRRAQPRHRLDPHELPVGPRRRPGRGGGLQQARLGGVEGNQLRPGQLGRRRGRGPRTRELRRRRAAADPPGRPPLRHPHLHRLAAVDHQVDRTRPERRHPSAQVRGLLLDRDDVPGEHGGPGDLQAPDAEDEPGAQRRHRHDVDELRDRVDPRRLHPDGPRRVRSDGGAHQLPQRPHRHQHALPGGRPARGGHHRLLRERGRGRGRPGRRRLRGGLRRRVRRRRGRRLQGGLRRR